MTDKSHDERIKEQIGQYARVDDMHAQLADIFRYWQQQYFKPRFQEVCSADNHFDFYAKALAKRINSTGVRDVISFGSGDAQVEVGVARLLEKSLGGDFRFHCVELSPLQIDRARSNADKAGLIERFTFIEADFNTWQPGGQVFAGAMCHHALHHVQDLEHLFGAIREALHPDGAFVSIDVVGRNGHMRWPEAQVLIEKIWAFLPEGKRYHHILKRTDLEYENRDCSNRGFEGIRAQDILPLLTEHFGFENFLCFGNLIDVFTSRGYGANFDANNPLDCAFIDFVQYLNDLLIDLGHIKPTRMCAVMTLDKSVQPRVYKDWTPRFCLRAAD